MEKKTKLSFPVIPCSIILIPILQAQGMKVIAMDIER